MRTKKLGWTDLQLSVIGLGTWAIGGPWQFGWGPQDDADSIAAITYGLDLGINWIDTAAAYGLGHSEEVVGKAICDMSEKPIVATKCGLVPGEDSLIQKVLKRESVMEEAEASLKRLQVDVIDLYQIHWPLTDEENDEAWIAIGELIKQGKIRYGGVSNFDTQQLKRAKAIHPVASLQPPYSMFARGIEAETLEFCGAENIGVIAYSPMYMGLLTGKFTRERAEDLAKDDHRYGSPAFSGPGLDGNLKFVDALRPIAERNDMTVAQLAIAWVLRREEVTAAIVGARRPSQIEETAPAGDKHLPEEDIAIIKSLLDEKEVGAEGS
ncbi:aldo/keto reductase [Candidatus Hydrogenedentota bacterium]